MQGHDYIHQLGKRQVSWREYGDTRGKPVVVAHGTPGSRLQVAQLGEDAASRGVRLLCLDRPGYGLTSPLESGSWTEDISLVLDTIGCEKAVIAGVSGGAKHAVDVALEAPDRCVGLVLASAMLPGTPLLLLQGRLKGLARLLWVAERFPRLARRLVGSQASPDPAQLQRQLSSLPEADRAALQNDRYAEMMSLDLREALKQGPDSVVADLGSYGKRSRRQDLGSISVPTRVLHGDQDRNVPIAAARWAASLFPDAQLCVIAAGHHFLATHRTEWWEAIAELHGEPEASSGA